MAKTLLALVLIAGGILPVTRLVEQEEREVNYDRYTPKNCNYFSCVDSFCSLVTPNCRRREALLDQKD